jgi:hypothetical protein
MHVERDMQKKSKRLPKRLRIPPSSAWITRRRISARLRIFVFFDRSFPRVHETCDLTMINTHIHVFHWKGKNAELLSDSVFWRINDVVPAAEETLANWTYPPFSGTIADGNIYGRGTLERQERTDVIDAAPQKI